MKRTLSFLLTLGIASVTAHAQSTMPAMGTNTPKGEVAKTDASINQASVADKGNAPKSANKRADKAKARKSKPMTVPQ